MARKSEVKPEAHLVPEFIAAMEDIGRYGYEKYGIDSFQHKRINDNRERHIPRTQAPAILNHIGQHVGAYGLGIRHDHFKTRRHQLAAIAFNAMMEFWYAGLDTEP